EKAASTAQAQEVRHLSYSARRPSARPALLCGRVATNHSNEDTPPYEGIELPNFWLLATQFNLTPLSVQRMNPIPLCGTLGTFWYAHGTLARVRIPRVYRAWYAGTAVQPHPPTHLPRTCLRRTAPKCACYSSQTQLLHRSNAPASFTR